MRMGKWGFTRFVAAGVAAAAVLGVAGAGAVTVGTNVNITKSSGYEGEPTIAIQQTNTQHVFAAYNTASASGYKKSTDGGATWTNVTTPPSGASCCDNETATDSFGNIFLVDIDASRTNVRLFVSGDGGDTWASLGAMDSVSTQDVDQPAVAANGGEVCVYWNETGGFIKARCATVNGLGSAHVGAFSPEATAPDSTTVDGQFGDIAVGPGGSSGPVTVTYQSDTDINNSQGPGTIYVNTDANGLTGGLSLGSQVAVTGTNVGKLEIIPAQDRRSIDAEANLAYDRSGGTHNGRLYLNYTDENPQNSDDTNIFVRHSDDNGATWSSAVKVNDDATTRSQFFQRLVVDQTTGVVGVSWYDARNDANNNNVQYFGAFSSDGGLTFGTNFQISAGTSNDDYPSANPNDYGDYSWADFHAGTFRPIWIDNSNSTGDNPAGANSFFDVYTSAVTGAPTGITVTRLDASRVANAVAIRWSTAQETGVAGFNLFRAVEGRTTKVNRTLIRAKAAGRAIGATYRFVDRSAPRGATYTYRLQVVALNGTQSWEARATLGRS